MKRNHPTYIWYVGFFLAYKKIYKNWIIWSKFVDLISKLLYDIKARDYGNKLLGE